MIFMHNKSGDIFEICILNIDDSYIFETPKGKGYMIGDFAFFGQDTKLNLSQYRRRDIALNFTFIGFV